MLMNLMLLRPISLKLRYSPGLKYIILPRNWGCSNNSQWPSITWQDMQSFVWKRSMMLSQSSCSSWDWPLKFSLSKIFILNWPLCCFGTNVAYFNILCHYS